MPVIPGASEVLWRLSDQGIWIRIISHRLYVNWGHATAAGDTADWLDRANIPYRDYALLELNRRYTQISILMMVPII